MPDTHVSTGPQRSETPAKDRPPHARPAHEVLHTLDADAENGLGAEDAARRLAEHGPNRLPTAARREPLKRFAQQFANILIAVLLGAAVVTAALGHWIDTGVILGVVLINAVIGFLQEGKAENALAAIAAMLSPQATVTRDGRRQQVPAADLVPGDLVHLASGDKVPADLRLLRARSLQIQEAALTGESVPVDKDAQAVAVDADLGDRSGIAHSGTLVVAGRGTGVVVATGARTEIGRISSMLSRVATLTTPLLQQMAVFGRYLTAGILALAALAFGFGVLLRGYGVDEMFLAAVGLAVAAIPEGLPAIMTITLAIGVGAMARRNAIIRRLPAVETLGAVTVICSDKTGTLTRNEMTVRRVATQDATFEVTGEGYGAAGEITLDGTAVTAGAHRALADAIRAGDACNDAELSPDPDDPDDNRLAGNPVDGALKALALKAGGSRAGPRRDTIPFESAHKFMASLHDRGDGRPVVWLKGAPERVFALCDSARGQDGEVPLDTDAWHARLDRLAGAGYRLLAVAERPAEAGAQALSFAEIEQGGFTLLGLFALLDPARAEAATAVGDCKAAGIAVKMITGDHAATAGAVARELGIGGGRPALTGHELDRMNDAELAEAVTRTDVFARTTPEHKLRLVSALQTKGQVAAMTGDGVNDAPALKRADVGVAMGRRGTEASKEAAEMVLGDDNFASIAAAVREGRIVYDNLTKAILFILPTNGGQAFTLLAAIVFGTLLPITPVQILWVNMVTAVTLALALAFEAGEPGVMARPPRRRDAPILSGFLIWRVGFVSALLVIAVFGLFAFARDSGMAIAEARTLAVNALVAGEIVYLFSARRLDGSALSRAALTTARPAVVSVALVMALQGLFTYWPAMQTLFGTAPLPRDAWAAIAGCAVLLFAAMEGEKAVLRRFAGAAR
ncbi:carbonate dehydratase [Rhodovibrio sodomensis]|uniref:Carbonate dehydratase n=1 Tax=Rhodovibrio sodomensis TaxID=1088 RepID=A0ABS1DCB9_9PROT|nr:HAD-IC family P-type ATPase [Rhodovibrio sodomensis]MBK1668113.1 carbonate dehydratase [Rhodovibrio sodomensis]